MCYIPRITLAAVSMGFGVVSDRRKSYADRRRRDLKLSIGDLVFVKISPLKSVIRFGRRAKLTPRFVGPFPVLERLGI